MSSFLELQNDLYFGLGTTDRNQAFPRAQMKRLLNQAKDAFYEDCLQSYPDVLARTRTLVADTTDPTSYVFAGQDPSLGDVAYLTEVRLDDAEGYVLEEVPFSERFRRRGLTYSLLGVGSGITLYAGVNVNSGTALWLSYVLAAEDLVDDGDTPDWLPARFHDVLWLKACYLAAGSGNEQTMSPQLIERMQDREAQARFAFGQRSLTPTTMRER